MWLAPADSVETNSAYICMSLTNAATGFYFRRAPSKGTVTCIGVLCSNGMLPST